MSAITYPIHERFITFQGEGVHTGKPAFFIRLYGCPVKCPWCDSAGTWHPSYVPPFIQKKTVEELAIEAGSAGVDIVVITGGEPAIFDLVPLVVALQEGPGVQVHLETSGGFLIKGLCDWITLSPKKWKPPIAAAVERAHEFKVIVEAPEDISLYEGLLTAAGMTGFSRPIWLHPEWSKRQDAAVLSAISLAVCRHEFNYRAGWQLHKLYKVDQLDPRSAGPVPLGGEVWRGY